MKYVLDFDRTLFDTEALYAAFVRDGVDYTQLSPDMLQGYQAADFLYPDTVPFLQQHQPSDVMILTAYNTAYGAQARAFQQAKVEQVPIRDLVSDIHYVEQDKAQSMRTIAADCVAGEQLVFVDDLLEHCASVKAAVPHCHCFLMQRQASSLTPPPGISIISSLHQIDELLAAAGA